MAPGKDAAVGFAVWDKLIRQNLYAVVTLPTVGIYLNDTVVHGAAHLATAKGGYLAIVEDANNPDGNPSLLGGVTAIFDEDMDPIKYIVALRAGDDVVAGYVMVADSPDQLFVAQEDSDSNAITLTEGGQNANIVTASAGSSVTGISKQEINSNTAAATAALNVKLVRPHPLDTPTEDYCRYVVQLNEHYYGDTMAGI